MTPAGYRAEPVIRMSEAKAPEAESFLLYKYNYFCVSSAPGQDLKGHHTDF